MSDMIMKRIMLKGILSLIVCTGVIICTSIPSMAQIKKNSITALIDKSPGYYDEVVRGHFKRGEWTAGKKLLDEGINVGLGTDVAAGSSMNMLKTMLISLQASKSIKCFERKSSVHSR